MSEEKPVDLNLDWNKTYEQDWLEVGGASSVNREAGEPVRFESLVILLNWSIDV